MKLLWNRCFMRVIENLTSVLRAENDVHSLIKFDKYGVAPRNDRFDFSVHKLIKGFSILVYEPNFLQFFAVSKTIALDAFALQLFVHLFRKNLFFWKFDAHLKSSLALVLVTNHV